MPGTGDEVVLDANVLVGLADPKDSLSHAARALVERLEQRASTPVLIDFVVGEALTVLCRRFDDRATDEHLERELAFAEYIRAEKSGEVRRLAHEGYARFDRVLALVRETSGRLNTHDAMLVVLQRDGIIGAVATLDEPLAATPGFVRAG